MLEQQKRRKEKTMARKHKQMGILWYSMNSRETPEEQFLNMEYGTPIVALRVGIDRFIAQNDYYCELDETVYKRLSMFYGLSDRDQVDEMIERLVDIDVYDAEIFDKYHILTSELIQDTFKTSGTQRVKSRRKKDGQENYTEVIYKELWLVELGKKKGYFTFHSWETKECLETIPEQFQNSSVSNSKEPSKEPSNSPSKKPSNSGGIKGNSKNVGILSVDEIENQEFTDAMEILQESIDNAIQHGSYESMENKDSILDVTSFYFKAYKAYRGMEHPTLSDSDASNVVNVLSIPVVKPDDGVILASINDVNHYKRAIAKYFTVDFKGNNKQECDYRIRHFITKTVLINRLQETE